MQQNKVEPVTCVSADPLAGRVAQLKALFPEASSEGKIDLDKLQAALGDVVDNGPERYTFTWAGKRDAIRILQMPTRATLVPCPEESVNWESTRHLFVEGDNLEVLKLLFKPYFGRVKMIYIDPPYNTGNDFIYPDSYADPLGVYLRLTGQQDEAGNLLTSNPETGGRYHSAWLSMMYPRLFLARQLLREDGVIFVSIDDHEVHNLRMMMNEVFGEENFLAELVWEKTRKNDARFFSVGHDYMVVYAKSQNHLRELNTYWREAKPGALEIQREYLRLRGLYGQDDEAVAAGLKAFYAKLPKKHPAKKHVRYCNVDSRGVWRDDNMSWPGGGGPEYDVIHPVTSKPCKVPEGGWRYSTKEKMLEMIEAGVVVFREDHTEPPIRKTYLVRFLSPDESDEGWEEEDENDIGIQVMGSYFYRSAQPASTLLTSMFGKKIFDNPKDHEVIARMIRYCTEPGDVVLDFFAGSCTTAQAVLELNREDGGNRRFIMVQLPEPTPEGSPAREVGYKTIADIGKERVRRVIARMRQATAGQLPLETRETPEDLGFKVFKLAPSNFRPWAGVAAPEAGAYAQQMELFADPLVEGWTAEKVVAEVALKEAGFGLNYQVELLAGVAGQTVYRVVDPDKGQTFHICLDARVRLEALKLLELGRDDLFVCRAGALDDETAANLALQCRLRII